MNLSRTTTSYRARLRLLGGLVAALAVALSAAASQARGEGAEAPAPPDRDPSAASGDPSAPRGDRSAAGGELVIAKRPEPPLPPCAKCESTGRCKVDPPKQPYVLFESDPAPDPSVRLGWTPCPACPRGREAQAAFDLEKSRLAQRQALYRQHEERAGLKFLNFETAHFTGHFQTTAPEARQCALNLAKLAERLGQLGASAYLPDRPDVLHIVVCEDEPRFGAYLDYFTRFVEPRDDNWVDLARKSASFGTRNLAVLRRNRLVSTQGSSLDHLAVFCVGNMLVDHATNGHGPDWLCQGFSSFCESLLFGNPRCYSIRYEENPLEFEVSWAKALAEALHAGNAQPWTEIFRANLIGMSRTEYQECWSIVRFLAQTDKDAFAKLPGLLAGGLDSAAAVEKAYAKPVSQLEPLWKAWALQGR